MFERWDLRLKEKRANRPLEGLRAKVFIFLTRGGDTSGGSGEGGGGDH